MARRTLKHGTIHTGAVLPPLPAIPEPIKTREQIEHDQAQEAEIMRLMKSIREIQIETNLYRAVKLVHMAYRREGPLQEFFEQLGFKWQDLADSAPSMRRLLEGGSD